MIESLRGIPGLEELGTIADELGLDVSAKGRMVMRMLMRERRVGKSYEPNVFDETPFTTPIELRHTGTRSDSVRLHREIRSRVPFAECFIWRIRSLDNEWNDGVVLPADEMRLSVNGGLIDPFEAASRVGRDRYDLLVRQVGIGDALPQSVLIAIRYLELLCDADLDHDSDEQPGLGQCRRILAEFEDAGGFRFVLTSPKYGRMLHRRLRRLGASMTSDAARFLVDRVGLSGLLEALDQSIVLETGDVGMMPGVLEDVRLGIGISNAPGSFSLDVSGPVSGVAMVESTFVGSNRHRLANRLQIGTRQNYDDERIARALRWTAGESVLNREISVRAMSGWCRIVQDHNGERRPANLPLNEVCAVSYLDDMPSRSTPADEDLSLLLLVRGDDPKAPLGFAAPFAVCVSSEFRAGDGVVRNFRVACGSFFQQLPTGEHHLAFAVAERERAQEPPDTATVDFVESTIGGAGAVMAPEYSLARMTRAHQPQEKKLAYAGREEE